MNRDLSLFNTVSSWDRLPKPKPAPAPLDAVMCNMPQVEINGLPIVGVSRVELDLGVPPEKYPHCISITATDHLFQERKSKSMFDDKAVTAIADLATKAAEADFLYDPHIRPDVAWIRNNGQLTEVKVPPKRRSHNAHTVADFARSVSDLADTADGGTVWVGMNAAVAALNDAERFDSIHMRLEYTREFTLLSEWSTFCGGPKAMKQKDLILALKFNFANQLPELLSQIRKITWGTTGTAVSNKGHGVDTLGRTVGREVRRGERHFGTHHNPGARL